MKMLKTTLYGGKCPCWIAVNRIVYIAEARTLEGWWDSSTPAPPKRYSTILLTNGKTVTVEEPPEELLQALARSCEYCNKQGGEE